MKTILVPVEPDDLIESTLETAVLLGKAFGSYLEGFALCQALCPSVVADAIGAAVVYQANVTQDADTVQESRQVFEDFMRAHDVPCRTSMSDGPSFGWLEEISPEGNFVGNYSRVFDITVVGQPGAKTGQPRMSILETVLLESGRPILIAPSVAPGRLGENVVIAWNGSAETVRTMSLAMPILRQAHRTVVLTVEGAGVRGPTGDQVANYLGLNGIACESLSIDPGAGPAGEAILAEATKLGSDLLIKGAFTQSRLRQMIFGGATRYIIAEANLSVFMGR